MNLIKDQDNSNQYYSSSGEEIISMSFLTGLENCFKRGIA